MFQKRGNIYEKLPIIIAIIFLVSSSLIQTANIMRSQQTLRDNTDNASEIFALSIGSKIEHEISMIDNLMSQQWLSVDNTSQLYNYNRYLTIASIFYNISNNFIAINWISNNRLQ